MTHHFLRHDEANTANVLILLDQKYDMWKINCNNDFGVFFDPKHFLADISLTRAPTEISF